MPTPSVTWDAVVQRFRYRDGTFVSRAQVRRALEESLLNLSRRTDGLADDLRAGRISLNDWRAEMRDTIKQSHMASVELANGGRAQMTPALYGKVGQAVRTDYAYLERWVEQIKAGAPVDGTTEVRSKLYLLSARKTFLMAEAERMDDRGFLAKSVLHAAESCAECIAEAAKGYVPVSEIVPPGNRTCLGNCRCVLVYARAA